VRQFKTEITNVEFDQPKLTDLCLGRRNCWRSATGGKIFNGRAESEKFQMRTGFNKSRRLDHRNITSCHLDVPVCEQGDRALMAGFIRVVMNQLVQGLAGSQRGHGQNQPNQQGGNERPAELTKLFLFELQTVCNIANDMPPARHIFETRLCHQDIPLGFKRRERSLCRITTGQFNTPPPLPIKRPEAFRFEPLNQAHD
jgi:hypothetical protein